MLGQGNYEIKTVSAEMGEVRSISRLRAVVDHDVNTAPADFEALVLIGGMSWRGEAACGKLYTQWKCVGGYL